jgi:hypothetical protein
MYAGQGLTVLSTFSEFAQLAAISIPSGGRGFGVEKAGKRAFFRDLRTARLPGLGSNQGVIELGTD